MKTIFVSDETRRVVDELKRRLSDHVFLGNTGCSYNALLQLLVKVYNEHPLSHDELTKFLSCFPKRGRPRVHERDRSKASPGPSQRISGYAGSTGYPT